MQSEASKRYWDSVAEEYLELTRRRLEDRSGMSELLSSLPVKRSPLDVLDVGTGSGLMAVVMARLGNRVVALDSSPRMLETAERLFEESGVSVKTVLGDACDTGLPEESFDVVVAKDTLFTLELCADAVLHWRSLIRPGGYLIIVDGDYCFYAWNADYSRRRDYVRAAWSRDDLDFAMGGIDISPLRAELETYYVNRVRRPGWETWFLSGLGFVELRVRFRDETGYETVTRYGRFKYPAQYTMVARKPSREEEGQRSILPDSPTETGAASDVASAMASGVRTEILARLSSGEMTVSQLNEGMGLESGHMSYHLRVLRNAGLVEARKVGRNSFYRLADPDRVKIILNTAATVASEIEPRGGDGKKG